MGLAVPGRVWHDVGARHPFGEDYNGLAQFLPESYDRPELDRAIAAVPMEVLTQGPLLWGTPEQAVRRLREFGEAGLSHVVLAPVSGLVSPRASLYGLRVTGTIAYALGVGR